MMSTEESEREAADSHLQRFLRFYGKAIGCHPLKWGLASFLICVAVALPGWLTRNDFGGNMDFMNPLDMELTWSITGGRQEQTIQMWFDRHGEKNEWDQPYTITMFAGKGDNEGKDIITHDAFLEILELHKKWTSITVEVNNLTYTTWDLCSRGILPDIPGMPYMPCLSVSPLHCFREEGEINHASYQSIDPVVDKVISGAIPYSTRPSLVNSSDAEIKASISTLHDPSRTGPPGQNRGCKWWTSQATFVADYWGGGLEWSPANTLTKATALRMIIYLDGIRRIAYRMSIMKPTHTSLYDISEAQRLLSARWKEICIEHSKEATHIEVANLEHWAFFVSDQLEDEHSQVKWGYIACGVTLMNVFCAMVLVAWRHPMASRADLGFKGLLVVAISQATSFGTFFLLGKYLNPPMLLGLPLLALGLGVDDMFVLLRYFSDLGVDYIDSHSQSETLGAVQAQAGPGTTLTSVCNALVFGCGALLPIAAMADFCLCAALVAAWNYFCMINIFMPMMAAEIARVKARRPDPHFLTYFCQRRIMKQDEAQESQGHGRRASKDATSALNYTGGLEKRAVRWLRQHYAPWLAKPVVNIVMTLLSLVCFTTSLILIANKSVGYSPAELFPKDDHNYKAVDWIFNKFALFTSYLCFHDLEISENQREMLQLYKDLGDSEFAMYHSLPPYLTMLYLNTYAASPAADPNGNTTIEDVGFDTSWTEPYLAPFGTLTSDPQDFYTNFFNPWRQLPADPSQAWDPAKRGFMYADMVKVNEFRQGMYTDDAGIEKMSFSYFSFSSAALYTEDVFVDAVTDAANILNKSPLSENAFVYGSIFTFWEVFLELDRYMYFILLLDAGVIFLVTLLISSFDVITAVITCLACTMIALEVYGLSVLFMSFNVFVAAISLMGIGLSVEFTAHFAMAFNLASGAPVDRMATAMAHTFPALVEGSLSTFCSILPLAFSPTLFEVKYLFGITSMVVVVGMINGLTVMPGLLGFLSPLITRLQRLPRARGNGAAALGGDDAKHPTILNSESIAGGITKESEVTI